MAKTNKEIYIDYALKINKRISNLTKKGYLVDESTIPTMPKRVTQKRLKEIKDYYNKEVYKNAYNVDIRTGEAKTRYEELREKRLQRNIIKKLYSDEVAEGYDTILNNVVNLIDDYMSMSYSQVGLSRLQYEDRKILVKNIRDYIFNYIGKYDRITIAKAMQDNADKLLYDLNSIFYDSEDDRVKFDTAPRFIESITPKNIILSETALTEVIDYD